MGLTDYFSLGFGCAVLILASLLYAEHQKVLAYKARETTYQMANTLCKSDIEHNNQTLDKIADDGKKASEAAGKAVAKAAEENKGKIEFSNQIKAAAGDDNDCKAATALLNNYLKRKGR